ncbi:MAG TPA: DedA family protein [Gemmatimonadaceae bacterium]|nr:DedA family protein [Gemmatimonadaceae bacterium]
MVQGFLDWLVGLPLGALYAALGVVAALENIFPPIPADTVVAVGSFLAARGQGSAVGAFLATWLGNVGGAMIMYGVGRCYGAARLERRLLGARGPGAELQLQRMYGRYGIAALFISRFIPAVRALVPPFAGALRIPPLRTALAMGLASAIWYGIVSYVGFTVGGNWQRLSAIIGHYGRDLAIAATAIVALGAGVWWYRYRRRTAP